MKGNVSPDRLRDRTLALVEVESPTGDTADAARLYAGWLQELGMEVEVLDDVFPATPTVVGRLKGGEPGPTVVLYAHLDTVPIPHDPPRIDGDRIYGRGSADMKGAAVCALETAQVLAESGPFAGELVLVLIGLHEAPGGRGEDLTHLLAETGLHRRLRPSSASCRATTSRRAHGPGDRRDHDHAARDADARAADAARHAASAARRGDGGRGRRGRREELAAVEHPWVGAETYFVGEVHGGDFYNRWPASCRHRRHAPLGARQHARGGRGRVPRAARRASPPRPAARSTSTCASCAARTRSTSTTSSRARSATRTRR